MFKNIFTYFWGGGGKTNADLVWGIWLSIDDLSESLFSFILEG